MCSTTKWEVCFSIFMFINSLILLFIGSFYYTNDNKLFTLLIIVFGVIFFISGLSVICSVLYTCQLQTISKKTCKTRSKKVRFASILEVFEDNSYVDKTSDQEELDVFNCSIKSNDSYAYAIERFNFDDHFSEFDYKLINTIDNSLGTSYCIDLNESTDDKQCKIDNTMGNFVNNDKYANVAKNTNQEQFLDVINNIGTHSCINLDETVEHLKNIELNESMNILDTYVNNIKGINLDKTSDVNHQNILQISKNNIESNEKSCNCKNGDDNDTHIQSKRSSEHLLNRFMS